MSGGGGRRCGSTLPCGSARSRLLSAALVVVVIFTGRGDGGAGSRPGLSARDALWLPLSLYRPGPSAVNCDLSAEFLAAREAVPARAELFCEGRGELRCEGRCGELPCRLRVGESGHAAAA